MSRKKASILNLVFNYANVAFLIVNGIVLVPIYLKHFSVSTYGSFLASGNIVSMIGLLDGGMSYVLTQKLADSYSKRKHHEFNKIVTSGLIITILISILILLFSFLILPFISDIVKAESNQYSNIQVSFILSAISACLGIFYNNLSSIFQSTLKVQYTGYSNIISIIIGLAGTLFGLYFNLGIVSIPLGFFIKSLVSCLVLLFFLNKVLYDENKYIFRYEKNNLITLFNTALPMFGGSLAKSVVSNSQLLIINIFINPTTAAVYFITARIFQICDSFLAPIGSAIYSSISQINSIGDNQDIKNVIEKVFSVFTCFSIVLLSSSFLLNESFINLLLGAGKFGGSTLSLLIATSMFFYTRFNFITVNLFALGTFGKTTLYDFIGGVIKLCIIFSLIKYLGVIVLPISELFVTIFISGIFLNNLITKKLNFIRNEAIKFIFTGFMPLLVIIIFDLLWIYLCPQPDNLKSFLINAIIIGLISILLILILSRDVKEIAKTLFTKLKRKPNAKIYY